MSDSSIRDQILKLAVADPDLRPELADILRGAGGLSDHERSSLKHANTVVIQQAPIVVQQGDPNQSVVTQGAPAAPMTPMIVSPTQPVAPPPSANASPIGVPAPTGLAALPPAALPADQPYIYVKVRNRGCTTISGQVHVYWA
jgi:hypothetical protein